MLRNTSANHSLTDEQFESMMTEYAALSYGYEDGNQACIVGSSYDDANKLLDKYGFKLTFDKRDNISETDFLQTVESLTGRNTFKYSKTAYMDATDVAVDKSVKSKRSTVKYLKEELRKQEEQWHKDTGRSELGGSEIRGRNLYRDDEHLKDVMQSEKVRKFTETSRQFVDTISAWDNSGYVVAIYNLVVACDEYRRDKVKHEFADRDDFRKPFTSKYVDLNKSKESKVTKEMSPETRNAVDKVMSKYEQISEFDTNKTMESITK